MAVGAGGNTLQSAALLAMVCALGACDKEESGRGGTGYLGLGTATTGADDGESAAEVYECQQVEVPAELGYVPLDFGSEHEGLFLELLQDIELGDPVLPDVFRILFREGEEGSYELGEDDNQSFRTCGQCVDIGVDVVDGYATKTYFQQSGRLEIDPGSKPLKGSLESDLVGIRLVEVEIDPETGATSVVDGGDCFELVDREVVDLQIDDWTCPSGYYGLGDGCDCGCGVFDPDCQNDSSNACDYCDSVGSCSGGTCPGAIDPNNNAVCDVETAWTCDLALYDGGDGCDCGCGLIDLDCNGNGSINACDTCNQPGSCAPPDTTSCVGVINTVNNSTCSPVLGWTCDPSYYAANDGCDCGCGVKDPDCNGGEVDACEFCNEAGSCAEGEDNCASIDPKDTSVCG